MIDKALGLGSPDPAETYSSSPHLYAELGIPAEAGGKVGAPRKSPVKRRDTESSGQVKGPSSGQIEGQKSGRDRSGAKRRRTRGGQPVSGHPAGNGATTAANGEAAAETPSSSSSGGTNRRRRRRRKPTETTAASALAN
jgi:hypothetical protein